MLPYVSMSTLPEGLICHYCTADATTRDHVVPKTKMGVDSWWNLIPSCRSCNEAKASRMPTCGCAFCRRALHLFEKGWKRNRPRGKSAPDGYVMSHGPQLPIPKSFEWSV